MADDKNDDKNDDKIGDFDQTNGLAGNLQGDDGRAETPPNQDELHLIPKLIADPSDDYDEDANTESGYSEEGRD